MKDTAKQNERMKELIARLNEAGKAYYSENREIMSNYEYDALYDELVALEEETGIQLGNSPTANVGYEALSQLPRQTHETPMLSLGKTKNREELREWLQGHEALLSWKLDGLTIVLTYENGELVQAVTRGNGEVGEVITNNAKTFQNIPLRIAYKGSLVIRGEAVISYSDFERINQEIPDADARYKNPRNLCSGSVRQLNNEITAKRNVRFIAFSLVSAQDMEFGDSFEKQLLFLQNQGFETVWYQRVTEENILETIEVFANKVRDYEIPSDGLVLTYDELSYGKSLGRTAKFPRSAIAFKWADETAETILREIEWSPSRTGLINPVAIFEPVELEGTSVSRASVHNVSIVESLELGIGDRISVYKANMIIPQIAENYTRSGKLFIPEKCPVCGAKTEIRQQQDTKSLYCTNPNCAAKKIKAFELFVSRDALNIDGCSSSTLEKLIAIGAVRTYRDLFHLKDHEKNIMEMEGFGTLSCQNLLDAVEKARHTSLFRLLYGMGIPGVGLATAKLICRHFHNDLSEIMNGEAETYSEIEGIGPVLAGAICSYFSDLGNCQQLRDLYEEMDIEQEAEGDASLEGNVFVITGSLHFFENRNALKELLEQKGAKVTGSVTGKTTCLINNDLTSTSGKNKKAKELGVAIMSEEEFLRQYGISLPE